MSGVSLAGRDDILLCEVSHSSLEAADRTGGRVVNDQ